MYTEPQKQNNKNNDFKNLTRGGQILFHNFRMWFQVNQTLFKICKWIWMLLTVLFTWLITPKHIYMSAWYWCQAQAYPILELLDIKLPVFKIWYYSRFYYIHPSRFLQSGFVKFAYKFPYYLAVGAAFGLIGGVIAFFVITRYLTKKGEKQTANQYIRGAKLDTPQNVAKVINKQKGQKGQKIASDIVIDGLPIITNSETRHFLVHGSTGTGKTQLISKILDHLRKRGDRVFLYDKGGVYTSTFYCKDTDKILNPFDIRCENWDLWREATMSTDFENMAESLIPMHGETDPFWVNAARTIFGSAAFTMKNDSDRAIKKLLNVLLTSELSDLHNYLSGTEAATLTSDKIEKTAISIRSVITTYLKSLRFMTAVENNNNKKPTFCIRDWICNERDVRNKRNERNKKNEKNNGWLFLSSNAAQHASLKPLLSMWFSMATIALLALPENSNRRIWFVCDELPSLHKLPQLPESIAEARKYGGCFVLGMQSYAQLEKVYGKSAGKEIFDLMNTAFFFRSPSPDMAELVSRALGEQEIEDLRENYSYGANTIRDGISIGTQRMVNQIVTPAEIMDLENMKCYVRLAGSYPISLLELTLNERPAIAKSFIQNRASTDKEIDELIDQYDSNIRNFRVKKKPGAKSQKPKETEANNVTQGNKSSKNTDTDKNNTIEINPLQKKQKNEEEYEI